jgi:hypothetical protein
LTKNCRFAGIVNADCNFLGYPNLSKRIRAGLDRTLLYAQRVDIDTRPVVQPHKCCSFDAFFFDAAVIPTELSEMYRIGDPWWDYYLPIAVALRGTQVAKLETPFVTHNIHDQNWSQEDWERIGLHFWGHLQERRLPDQPCFPKLGSEADVLWACPTLTRSQLDVFALACFKWLQARRLPRPLPLLPSDMAEVERLLRRLPAALIMAADLKDENALLSDKNALLSEKNALREKNALLSEKCVRLTDEITRLIAENAELNGKCTAMELSTSWRVTKPLRRLKSML